MDKPLYDEFYNFEKRHWWFVSRQRTFTRLIKQYLQNDKSSKILDIGCGTGLNMESLADLGDVTGIDYSMNALQYCSNIGNPLCQANMSSLPFQSNSFDLITALDVIEHIEDDIHALKEVNRVCNNNGIVLLAVPAFQFLWGEHDDMAHHIRRYSLKELRNAVDQSGFEILKISYSNFFLFPIGLIYRYLKRFLRIFNKNKELKSDFLNTAPPIINPILREIFTLEGKLLKYLHFPFGLSIICVCRKIV